MSAATPHAATRIYAGHAVVLAVALASLTDPARAQPYVVEWPAERQHLLEGRYTGSVRDESRELPDCEFQAAELLIRRDRRYAITLRCDEGPPRTRTIQGRWWIDEIAGSCLILIGPDASSTNDDYLYGFRIHDAAQALHQDGGRCQSADERDAGMVLVRRRKGRWLMSRWRPPAEKSTALITPEGHARLKAELDELWRVRRPEVVRALSAAAAEGDRSENAEYTYRKKQLGEIDRRVRYLSKRLESLRVVDTAPSDPDAIFFGAHVEVEDTGSGDLARYRIVGPDETDAKAGWISIDSPLARAMLKKRVDDAFEVQLPAGPARFAVVAVDYRSG